jgi:hypothetical protein
MRVIHWWKRFYPLSLVIGFCAATASGQIDPVKRELIQIGYNGALEGHAPLAAYAFCYWNQPGFLETNLTLRLAVAPVYVDSELGIRHALGEYTDVGIGLAGGGYADSYEEIDQGRFIPSQSFIGDSGEASLSVYHLFNPGKLIPLNGMLRGIAHYSVYDTSDQTASNFKLPDDHGTFSVRTGLRWGGREPTLYPDLAMELSVWYEGQFRTTDETYGFDDRRIEPHTHLFWGEAFLAYTLPELKHSFSLGLTAGTTVDADRFSAYRLGGLLPLVSEFPLSLPGYYYQEISAQRFVLLGGSYILPVDPQYRWNIDITASTSFVDYLSGVEQPGHWNSGVGGGLLYKTPTWKVMAGYAYGVNAIRTSGRGANSIGIWIQLDLEHARGTTMEPTQPGLWRGVQRIFGL